MDIQTSKVWYREIPASQVDPQVYLAAHTMLEYVKADLGLPQSVEIRWVVKDDPLFSRLEKLLAELTNSKPETFEMEPFSGLTKSFHDNIIWIYANLTPQEAAMTVAHEARHLWQLKHYRPPYTQKEQEAAEKDAVEYEKKAYNAVFGRWANG
ncbi:MAG TPA: hypothetical protein DCE09_08285 [Thermoanaerobacter sp.]|nr:hypothetical protein [Thermoanaerobacter sp.]